MDANTLEITLKTKLEIILQKLGVDYSNVTVEVTEGDTTEDDKSPFKATISFESEEANLIIGYHGETLQSIRTVIQQHIFREFGEWVHIFLNVGNYLEDRNNKLTEIAEIAAGKAKSLGKSIALYPMNSFERRVVHEVIAKIDGVESNSDGEGKERRVIISNITD